MRTFFKISLLLACLAGYRVFILTMDSGRDRVRCNIRYSVLSLQKDAGSGLLNRQQLAKYPEEIARAYETATLEGYGMKEQYTRLMDAAGYCVLLVVVTSIVGLIGCRKTTPSNKSVQATAEDARA